MKKIFVFLILISCGEDYSGRRELPEREEVPSEIQSFETRLTNNLLVSGERCTGTEVVDVDFQSVICDPDKFLLTVDNENYCTPEGCTNVNVEPAIASLIGGSSDNLTTYFSFELMSPLDDQKEDIVDTLLLRIRNNDEPTVIFETSF